jgi:flagellar export protein FliJ
MKTFRFSLQAVLTVRQREEHFALEQYAQALLTRQQALDHLAVEERELAAIRQDMRDLLQAGVAAGSILRSQVFCQSLASRRDLAAEALSNAERAVQSTLQSMLEARRRREVVESCRNKQRVRHTRQCHYQEDRHHDELASRRQPQILAWRSPH